MRTFSLSFSLKLSGYIIQTLPLIIRENNIDIIYFKASYFVLNLISYTYHNQTSKRLAQGAWKKNLQ